MKQKDEEFSKLSQLLAERLQNKIALHYAIGVINNCKHAAGKRGVCDMCEHRFLCGACNHLHQLQTAKVRLQSEIEAWVEAHFTDLVLDYNVRPHRVSAYVDAYTEVQMRENGYLYESWEEFIKILHK